MGELVFKLVTIILVFEKLSYIFQNDPLTVEKTLILCAYFFSRIVSKVQ